MPTKDESGSGKRAGRSIWVIATATVVIILISGAALYFLDFIPFHSRHGQQAQSLEAATDPTQPLIYHTLDPAFIVYFKPNSEARLMQLALSVTATNQKVIDTLAKHTPMIRNNLLLLMSSYDPAILQTTAGKEALRARILEEIQRIVEAQAKQKGVKEIFFTGFVMQ
jgi:flagellar FliL protein